MARHGEILALLREDQPYIGPRIPRFAAVIAKNRFNLEPGFLEPFCHLRYRERAEDERKAARRALAATLLDVLLIEERQLLHAILPHRFDERDTRRPAA